MRQQIMVGLLASLARLAAVPTTAAASTSNTQITFTQKIRRRSSRALGQVTAVF